MDEFELICGDGDEVEVDDDGEPEGEDPAGDATDEDSDIYV